MRKEVKIIISILIILLISAIGILIYQQLKTPTNTTTESTTKAHSEDIKEKIYNAFINKNPEIYREFIDEGEDLNFLLEDNKTVLEHLINTNDYEYIEKLIDNGFTLSKIDTNHIDVITNILRSYEDNPFYDNLVINLIMQVESELNEEDSLGYSLLMNAIAKRNENITLELIKLLDDVNKVFNEETALTWACQTSFDNLEVIEGLVNKNADINFQGKKEYTCLMYLVENELIDILTYFIELPNLDFNLINTYGETVLHIAVDNMAFEALDIILDKKDKLDFLIKDVDGLTARELALSLAEDNPDYKDKLLEIADKLKK